MMGCTHHFPLQLNQASVLLCLCLPAPDWQPEARFSSPSSTLSGNIGAAAPGSVCLFSFFFLPHPNPSPLSLHHVSSVSLPFFSLTMKYSDTNLGGPLTPKHSCVAVPLSCHRTPRLPTLPLSSTNSAAFPFSPRCFLSLISSSLSLYSLLFRHSLYWRMAASKIRAKQSQHSCEHLFSIAARLLALVLHFTFDFSVSVRGTPLRAAGVWHATRLSKRPC